MGAFDTQGEQLADALRARPVDEDEWPALRRAFDILVEYYRNDPDGTLTMARLVRDTPALCARQLEKQNAWRPLLAAALAQRDGAHDTNGLRHAVLSAAAVDCLNVAVEAWTASGGQLDLETLIDDAFSVLRRQ